VRLQDEGYDDNVIETKVAERRKTLRSEELKLKDDGPRKLIEAHALAEAKKKDVERMGNAFGISKDRRPRHESSYFGQGGGVYSQLI
jgi:hypothetical protein